MENSTWLWRVLVAGLITVIIGMSSWTLHAVANMPKEYTSLEQFRELRKENRDDHKEILRAVRKTYQQGR